MGCFKVIFEILNHFLAKIVIENEKIVLESINFMYIVPRKFIILSLTYG